MQIIILCIILAFYLCAPCAGQMGNWNAGLYSGKHADMNSSVNQLGALAIVPQEGSSVGVERRYGLAELDIY